MLSRDMGMGVAVASSNRPSSLNGRRSPEAYGRRKREGSEDDRHYGRSPVPAPRGGGGGDYTPKRARIGRSRSRSPVPRARESRFEDRPAPARRALSPPRRATPPIAHTPRE